MKSPKSISKLMGGVGKLALLFAFVLLVVGLSPKPARAASDGAYVPDMYDTVSTTDTHSIANSTQDDLVCRAVDSSQIHCELDVGVSRTCFGNSNNGTCRPHEYYYDPVLSKRAGWDVFVAEIDSDRTFAKNAQDFGYVLFPSSKDGNYTDIVLSKSYKNINPTETLGDEIAGDDTVVFKKAAPSGTCSIILNGDGPKPCKVGGKNDSKDANSPNGKTYTAAQQGTYKSGAKKGKAGKSDDDCDGGGLSFVLCPMQNAMMDVVTGLNKYLGDLLDINTKGFQNSNLKDASAKLLNVANAMYAIIFLVIIFANALSIGIDNYTFKKILPRLVSAIILSQFAYFLTGAFIEIGNILGRGISATILSFTGAVATNPGQFSGAAFIALSGVAIFLMLLFLVIIIIALIVVVCVLALRWAALYVLILVAPLAFAAMVLPNTKKLFDMWWKNLLKLVMMYPIIMAITTGSVFLGTVMSGDGNPAVIQLVGAMLPFIGFMMVPKAFKWSGGLMAATGGKLADWGTKQAKSAGKEAWGKEGGYKDKLGAKGLPTSLGPISTMTGGRKRLEAKGLATARNQKAAEAGAGAAATQLARMEGGKDHSAKTAAGVALTADEQTEQAAFNTKQAKIKSLLKTLSTPEARGKLVTELAKSGSRSDIEAGLRSGAITESDMTAAKVADFPSMDKMADLRDWDFTTGATKPSFYKGMTSNTFSGQSAASQQSILGVNPVTGNIDGATLSARFDASTLQTILSDKSTRGSMSGELRSKLAAYAQSVPPGTSAHADAVRSQINASGNWV